MGKRLGGVRDNIGIALVLVSGLLMSLSMLLSDPVSAAVCGEGYAAVILPSSVMPLFFVMMIVGLGNSAKPYIKHLEKLDFGRRDLKRLILGLVVSGGSVYRRDGKYCIRYYGKDLAMHAIFGDLANRVYRTRPRTVGVSGRGTYVSQLYSKPAVLEMAELSPGLATRKGEVPTITYILEGDKRVRVEAVRMIMSTSGWVNCTFSLSVGATKVYPRLGYGSVLASDLVDELDGLMKAVPLTMERYENRKYPTKGYLATSDQGEMRNFLKAGGFVKGSTVKKGAFSGLEKNRLLQAFVDTRWVEFESREKAIELLTKCCSDSSLELNIYLDRLRLG